MEGRGREQEYGSGIDWVLQAFQLWMVALGRMSSEFVDMGPKRMHMRLVIQSLPLCSLRIHSKRTPFPNHPFLQPLSPPLRFQSYLLYAYQNCLDVQIILPVISCSRWYKTIIQTYLMEKLIQILKDHQAVNQASLTEKDIVILEKRPGMAEPAERRRSVIQGSISQNVPKEKFEAIMLKADEQGLLVDIEQALPVGGPFGDYGEIENVFDEGKTHLKHENGEVLLVDVWATWCGPCQRPMQHNQEMLVKNQAAWTGKVRIVAVSVDEEKEIIQQRVNTKGWNKIQHLTLLGWKHDHKLISNFSISGIPFVCLVDKFGKINFTGHPSSINLENRINELIAQDKEVPNVPAAPQQAVPANEVKANPAATLTKEFVQTNFANAELLCIKGNNETTLQKGVLSQKGTIEAFVNEGDHNTIEALNNKFYGQQLKINTVKTVDVPQPENPTCWECHAALTFPYYWLKWEEGTHFACVNCVEKPSTQQGHHFNYEKNSVLLLGPWKKIPVKGLGHNHQPEDITKHEDGHPFSCNGCGGGSGLGQPRYICLGCRADPNFNGDYVDLCQDCRNKISSEEMKEQLKHEHHLDAHPLLRVLYNVKGYYEY